MRSGANSGGGVQAHAVQTQGPGKAVKAVTAAVKAGNMDLAVSLWKTLPQDGGIQGSAAGAAIMANGGQGGFLWNWLKNLGLIPITWEV